jgi:hypothetical protein
MGWWWAVGCGRVSGGGGAAGAGDSAWCFGSLRLPLLHPARRPHTARSSPSSRTCRRVPMLAVAGRKRESARADRGEEGRRTHSLDRTTGSRWKGKGRRRHRRAESNLSRARAVGGRDRYDKVQEMCVRGWVEEGGGVGAAVEIAAAVSCGRLDTKRFPHRAPFRRPRLPPSRTIRCSCFTPDPYSPFSSFLDCRRPPAPPLPALPSRLCLSLPPPPPSAGSD